MDARAGTERLALTDERIRRLRTFRIDNWHNIEALPLLPHRVEPSHLAICGMIGLCHADKRKTTTPWIPGGLYSVFDELGRLHLLEVTSVVRGQSPCVWCYRPILRVASRRRL